MKQALIHIRCNTGKTRREKRDGRDVVIVPSATLPDDIVMNNIFYSAEAIGKSFKSLEGTPAPLGHPTVNGKFVSASDPQGIVRGFFGSWNENVRRENGRVLIDKVVDVAYANQSEAGKSVLKAIESEEPIHSSTGLLATLTPLENSDKAKWAADDIVFDHDCWLLNEDGAATPADGVGIFVNSSGDEIEVINSMFEDDLDQSLDWAVEQAVSVIERQKRVPLLEKIKAAIKDTVMGATAPEPTTNKEEDEMDLEELSGKVEALSNTVAGMDEKIGAAVADALKPLTDQLTANAEAEKAKADAEREKLVNSVVEANLLDEETAKVADAAVLNALIERNKPGFVTTVNGAFKPSAGAYDWAAALPDGE